LALTVYVGNASLLHQRLDASARLKSRVEDTTGTDAIGLSRILADNARVRGAVDGSELS
jgi:hypothetical protein